jgi:hypothetical protein
MYKLGLHFCKNIKYFLGNRLTMVVRLSGLYAGRLLLPRWLLILISLRGWVDTRAIARLEGLDQLKNPVASSGIRPATFRIVAQCLYQLRYRVTSSVDTKTKFNLNS